ncbi:hypothetical protein M0R72_13410 [Candidatus Pacearchaeota archaeon]|jgi:hypothetical protein|nr:hypothetical protein [Candidatus Pacearchaeota archaeon]
MGSLEADPVVSEILKLHEKIAFEQKRARVLRREYNSLVSKHYKLRDREALVQFKFCEHLRAEGIDHQEQVVVESGRIDVLTSACVIEIKYGNQDAVIYQAIGQLAYYGTFYPFHSRVIVITGNPSAKMQKVLETLGIEWRVFTCIPI